MKLFFLSLFVTLFPACSFFNPPQKDPNSLNLIPMPRTITMQEGQFKAQPNSTNIKMEKLAANIDPFLGKEGYKLTVTPQEICIKAHDQAGIFNAVQTLNQLYQAKAKESFVPCVEIVDYPAFPLRGFMHDVGRNFQTIDSLKEQLEVLSSYKINVFHWHLTDNPAWRVQSRIYPQLNEAKFHKQGRNQGDFYTFEQIHDLVAFAKKRNMLVIPELDMPGHSDYFKPTFGFKMESDSGMIVLEHLIDEFCKEFSKDEFPIIHIGSDEINIKNAKEFITRMNDKVKSNHRQAMIWNPGLYNDGTMLSMIWREGLNGRNNNAIKNTNHCGLVDASSGYLNSLDPSILVRKHFFHQTCGMQSGDLRNLGGILCCFPDIRVDHKEKIPAQNAVYPTAMAFAEATWIGRDTQINVLPSLPHPHSKATKEFINFEKRLEFHAQKLNLPFPYQSQSDISWYTPTISITPDSIVYGGSIAFNSLNQKNNPHFLNPTCDSIVLAQAIIEVDKPQEIEAIIGFKSPTRSNRNSMGIPEQNSWCPEGSFVKVNAVDVAPPVWKNPKANKFPFNTWFHPANEIPIEDEELTWMRAPVKVQLQKGKNIIELGVPKTYASSHWRFTFIPVVRKGNLVLRNHDIKLTAPNH